MTQQEIEIDASIVNESPEMFPHYCRNVKDKLSWLAYKFGYLRIISPKDTVEFNPPTNRYRITHLI